MRMAKENTCKLPIARFELSLSYEDIFWAIGKTGSASEKKIAAFEEAFAARFGLERAFYISSARVGMFKVLQAMNLAPKSRVLMPAWTHPSMPAMVAAAGHVPVIADVSKGTWTMGPENLADIDWTGIAAIVITHMAGCPANAPALEAEAEKRGIPVLEDCAQGFGASFGGRAAGSTGQASFYSFALTKNFTTISGGMLGIRSKDLAQKLESSFANIPVTPNSSMLPVLAKAAVIKTATSKYGYALGVYPCLRLGWSLFGKDMLHPIFEEKFTTRPPSRITKPAPVQAALGLRMLDKIDAHNAGRNKNGRRLLELLQKKNIPHVGLPAVPQEGYDVFMSFIITHPKRLELARELYRHGIDTSPGYLKPVDQVDVLKDKAIRACAIPNAEFLAQNQLHLPIYPSLTDDDLTRIADTLEMVCKKIS